MKKILNEWTMFEKILLFGSVILVSLVGLIFKSDLLTTICSIVGIITALLLAKGKNLGQIFGLLIVALYTIVSFKNGYYGEVMEDKKTYAIVLEEYYFNLKLFQTIKKYKALTVTKEEENANVILEMYDMVLSKTRDAQEIDADGNVLTSYCINSIAFEEDLTIEEVKERIKENEDFTWGKKSK